MDPVAKKLVTENISNLQLQCKNSKFDIESMDFMKKFLNSIDEKYVSRNETIKYSLYEKAEIDVEKELKKLFEKNLEKYINDEFNTKIYDFYKNVIKNSSSIIVENYLKDIKESIISRMKTAIDNNPNFQNLFDFSNSNFN